jgi:hypothetical protein
MRGRKIGDIGSSSRGMYIRNIADITPDWSYICSTADIPELSEIAKKIVGGKTNELP